MEVNGFWFGCGFVVFLLFWFGVFLCGVGVLVVLFLLGFWCFVVVGFFVFFFFGWGDFFGFLRGLGGPTPPPNPPPTHPPATLPQPPPTPPPLPPPTPPPPTHRIRHVPNPTPRPPPPPPNGNKCLNNLFGNKSTKEGVRELEPLGSQKREKIEKNKAHRRVGQKGSGWIIRGKPEELSSDKPNP